MSIRLHGLGGKGVRLMALLAMTVAVAGAQSDSVRAKPRTAGIIDGLVSDSALAPLDDVTVSFLDGSTRVVTGANGRFRFIDVPVGNHRILVRRIGSDPAIAEVQVAEGQVARPAFMLLPVFTELKGVRVEGTRGSANLQEFEARRKLGHGGYFLTAEQIDKSHVLHVGELIARMPNITTTGVGLIPGSAYSKRNPNGVKCPMQILVDGMPRGTDLSDVPRPRELMGLEVYHGPATVPVQYKRWSGSGFCGLIIAWTRDGSEKRP